MHYPTSTLLFTTLFILPIALASPIPASLPDLIPKLQSRQIVKNIG